MRVLAIDTALDACSVALWDAGTATLSRVERMARGQAEALAPMTAAALAQAGWSGASLDRIAVAVGPGSFTGLRVGIAFARGLALALDRPCVGVTTLEVLAAGAAAPRVVAAIRVAGGDFAAAWDGRREVLAPARLEPEDTVAALPGDWVLTGPGLGALSPLRPDWVVIPQAVGDPQVLAGLAAFRDPAGHPPRPLYLRGSGAKLPGGLEGPDG